MIRKLIESAPDLSDSEAVLEPLEAVWERVRADPSLLQEYVLVVAFLTPSDFVVLLLISYFVLLSHL